MNVNRLSSMHSGLPTQMQTTRGFRPVYSSQKRFAATEAGNKGGGTRLYASRRSILPIYRRHILFYDRLTRTL